MSVAAVHLAAYGTLMSGQTNPLDPTVRARLVSLGPCRMTGALYAVGPELRYPGLIDQADGQVRGELFRVEGSSDQIALVLATLDLYEMFDPRDAQHSAFVRRMVRLQSPKIDAWVYVYNQAATGATMIAIPSGDWTVFQAGRNGPADQP